MYEVGSIQDVPRHGLGEEEFDMLAAGYETPAAARRLSEAGHSHNRILLRKVIDLNYPSNTPDELRRGRDELIVTLARAQHYAPQVLDEMLTHPATGGWLNHTLRQAGEAQPSDTPLWVHIGYLGALAAATAVRAGVHAKVNVPTFDGFVMLPTVGAAKLPEDVQIATIEVDPLASSLLVYGGGRTITIMPDDRHEQPFWEPCRYITAGKSAYEGEEGIRAKFLLDDLDPYAAFDAPGKPGRRLESGTVDKWQSLLEEAWAILRAILITDHPQMAKEIARLRSIVPMPPSPRFIQLGASNGEHNLSVSLALPENALQFALGLVHEYAHNKLDKALKLFKFFHSDASARENKRFYSAWRHDPRPLRGHLHGTYASMCMEMFWEQCRGLGTAADRRLAEFWFAKWRRTLPDALHRLQEAAAEMTELGQRFVNGMAGTIARLQNAPQSPPDADALAELATASHAALWRAHHRMPPPGAVRDPENPWPDIDETVRPDVTADHLNVMLLLACFMASDPEAFEAARRDPESIGTIITGASPADLALITGDYETAQRLYSKQAQENPDNPAAIVGLGLATREHDQSLADLLLTYPHVVREAMRQYAARTGQQPSLQEVAGRLAMTRP